jgi:hypothetical protein
LWRPSAGSRPFSGNLRLAFPAIGEYTGNYPVRNLELCQKRGLIAAAR